MGCGPCLELSDSWQEIRSDQGGCLQRDPAVHPPWISLLSTCSRVEAVALLLLISADLDDVLVSGGVCLGSDDKPL